MLKLTKVAERDVTPFKIFFITGRLTDERQCICTKFSEGTQLSSNFLILGVLTLARSIGSGIFFQENPYEYQVRIQSTTLSINLL